MTLSIYDIRRSNFYITLADQADVVLHNIPNPLRSFREVSINRTDARSAFVLQYLVMKIR